MAETTVDRIKELLNEEKWTRAALNSYTIQNFKELDEVIDSTESEEELLEIREVCEEHLHHTRNSIIALYITGIIALNQQMVDDSNLVQVISIFADNHKWKVVEYLCQRILEFGENKVALSTLAKCYDNENETKKKYQIWERLIKVDFEEADIVLHLAEKEEEEGNIPEAVEYYKKAIHRYINKRLFSNIRDIWQKLIEYIPEETDLFFHVEKKVERTINAERSAQLLEELYQKYRGEEYWDKAIDILKRILTYDPRSEWARKEISECYRQKHANHSQLDEYIKLSNLNQSWRNIHEAIEDFEKHISFDEGNFVHHKTWGIGRIRSIKDNSIVVDFTRKRGHTMSLKMAVNALGSLAKDHIWVLKAVWPQEKLKEKVKADPQWALKTIIKSYDNTANMKQVKAELVPSVLTAGEWTSWSSEARKILKTDPSFGNLPEKVDHYVVRDTPISFEEKTYNRFRAEKSFFGRLKVMREFLKHNQDPESDYFVEMFDYFTGFVKSYNQINEQVVASYLLVNKIVRDFPFLNPGLDIGFKDLVGEIEVRDIETIFQNLDDNELKKDFLERLRRARTDWPQLYVRLFPHYLSRYIIDTLNAKDHKQMLKELFTGLLDQYKEKREAFIYSARILSQSDWQDRYDLSYEKVLIGMVHLLDITFREIDNKRDVTTNRRLNKLIQTFLFQEGKLEEYLMSTDPDSINRLFTLVDDVDQLDSKIRIELKHKIMERFPDFKFYGEEEKETVSRGLIVTRKMYDEKNRQLKNILDVEIPATSKEIGEARELGDLKENAEYKAGKEKLEMLNLQASKIKEDLERAGIFEKKDVDPSKVSFGTQVILLNHNTEEEELYQFFGPWESNPDKNVISYLSPFGSKLWNHKEGEDVKFEINERSYHYTIKKIEAAEF
ncbi:MAG TPA: transcription elongation factor GreA [Sediminispirochaeta sp.]|nr:transcription elongation factor GreA [Sediminispirochaeta sp.]